MSKLFSYGCSFTAMRWPTWPEILSRHFGFELVNRAKPSACNFFIAHRLINDINENRISKQDKIVIMWTVFNRRNKIISNDDFESPPDRVGKDSPEQSDKKLIEKNWSDTAELLINVNNILKQKKFDYDYLLAFPLTNAGQMHGKIDKFNRFDELDFISNPSVFETVFNQDFLSRTDFALTYNRLPESIIKNIKNQAKKNNQTEVEYIRSQLKQKDSRFVIFMEGHHTLLHQFEYLQKIYPNYTWSDELIRWVHLENKKILDTIW